MPRGVYERKPHKPDIPVKRKVSKGGYDDLLDKLRAERTKAENRVVALGTAIEALEALE